MGEDNHALHAEPPGDAWKQSVLVSAQFDISEGPARGDGSRRPKSIVEQLASDGVGKQPPLKGQTHLIGEARNQAPGHEVWQASPFAVA
jgi:hypothetical protein